MGKIITDARGLISQPRDPYWDAPVSRREAQKAVNDLALNDQELTNRCDTLSIVLNFILEDKLGIKDRKELDAFVEKKKAELAKIEAQMEAAQKAQAEAQQSQPVQPEQGAGDGTNG